MAVNKLTYSIGGRGGRLTVKTLIDALSDTLRALYGVGRDISAPEPPRVRWHIENASMSSPLTVTLAGYTEDDVDVVAPFMDAVRTIEAGPKRPRFLSDDTIGRLKKLVGVLNNGGEEIRFCADGEEIVPTQHLAANADALLHRRSTMYETLTELEGRLEALSVHGETPDFRIYDALTNRPTKCDFEPKDINQVADLIKSRARVRVRGLVKYDVLYRPQSIKVEALQELRRQGELPQLSDLHRAGIDITGGLDSVAYVRGLRDAE